MKRLSTLFLASMASLFVLTACAQADKSKRPSPPATASATLASGAAISINYSQPALKGRTMGKDIEPMEGKVWRAGANEATVFETSKDLNFGGQTLPAGKYGLFLLVEKGEAQFMFNKTWNQWGSGAYKSADDVLRVKAKVGTSAEAMDRLTYQIKGNTISLTWGNAQWSIAVQ